MKNDKMFVNAPTNLLIVFLMLSSGCSSTSNPGKTSQDDRDTTTEEVTVYNGPCAFEKKQKQNETFPFNTSDKIELAAYGNSRMDSYTDRELIANGIFAVPGIKQRVTLNENQTDSLFSIFYNFKPLPAGIDTTQADCYNPRHAVVFYKQKQAIAYFEICFECGGSKQSPGVDFGQFCPEKMCMLQNFFKTNKADFGIIDELCE